jgi:RNA polymerase sigma-70 factor (ECF subfamily)
VTPGGSAISHDGSTSRSLLARARSNDADAWDRMVTLYAPLVMYWCRRWNLPEEDTADVFQEVFRSVAASLGDFRKRRAGDTFRGWLRTITRNKVCDHYKRLQREPKGVGGTAVHMRLAQVPMEPPPEDEDDVETDAGEMAARDDLVRRALEQIRVHFRENTWQAFWRVTVDGRPTADVADELSMTTGAVRVAKSRVLQRLRDELGDLIE